MSRQVSDADLLDLGVGAPAAPTHGSLPVIHTQAPARSAGAKRRVSIPLIAAAVLVAVIGGAIGAWVFLGGKSGAGSDLRYLPDDPDFVVSANVSGMINSGAGQKIKSHAEGMLAAFSKGLPKDSKFKPEDVGRMTFGVKVHEKNGAGVIHFNRPVTEQEIPPLANGSKKTIGEYQVAVDHDVACCLIDPQTMLTGDENSLRKVLERNGPAKISDDLTAAMAEVDFSKSITLAGLLKSLAPAGGASGQAMPPSAGGLGMMSGVTDGIRGAGIQCDMGDDIRVHGVAVCRDSNRANQVKTMADGFLPLIKMMAAQSPGPAAKGMKILDTLQVSISGSTVRADMTIDVDLVLSMISNQWSKTMTNSAAAEANPTAAPAGVPTDNNPKAPQAP
jgi:hypothetical protein